MAMDFSTMKKNRNNFDALMKEVEKIALPTNESVKDERFWQPEVDKAGNGYAVIRFLPSPAGEEFPWVRTWSHAFQGPTGKWYIENSLTTLGKQDPVTELNTELWNSGSESNKEIARKQKRKLTYISNIYIVKDSANPEREGKVYLYKFGKKIFDKIKDVMQPQFEDEDPINPFDFWKGANFKLKIRNVEGFRNYDKSEFDTSDPLSEDDDQLKSIWEKQHSLQQFLAPDNFKSYDELKTKLKSVLEGPSNLPKAEDVKLESTPQPEKVVKKEPKVDEDEDLSYFAKLAETED